VSLTFAAFAVRAQTSYYLSADGNDANAGTSPTTSWKSITKLNSVPLAPGDAVMFHRGDEFHGQITLGQSGSAALPITFGAYGSSDVKPVITGAVRLSGWTLHHGAVYVARAPSAVKNVFCNAQQMTLARYPNSGLLTVSTTNGSTTLTSTGISQASGYWTGANIRLRTADFAFETRVITSFNGSSFTLASATIMPFTAGWGFYLDNKLEELDAPGEWCADPATNDVYFYAPNGADPNTLSVDATLLDFGVNGARSHITIQDLAFRYQAKAAIRFSGTVSNVQIRANDIFGQTLEGIRIEATSSGCVIDGNTVRLVNNRAIAMDNTTQALIANNTIAAIGLVQGYGVGIDPVNQYLYNSSSGITLWQGGHNTVRGNSLDSIGYIGIRPDGTDILVEYNVIRNTMLTLADGGAIYAQSVVNTPTMRGRWQKNYIENVIGNGAGVPQPRGTTACGLYLDSRAYDMRMEGNTIIRAGGIGIYAQVSSYRNSITDNLLYDCGRNAGGAFLQIVQDPTTTYGEFVIKRNTFVTLHDIQSMFVLQEENSFCHIPGTFDSNYYCNPYNSNNKPVQLMTNTSGWSTQFMYLNEWQSYSNQDLHSRGIYSTLDPFVVLDTGGTELIPNGLFSANINGWTKWDQNAQISHASSAGLDGGCLHFRLLSNSPSSYGVAISNPLQLTKDQMYRLRFSVIGPRTGFVLVSARQNHSPFATLADPVQFPIGPARSDHIMHLVSNATDANARFDFQITFDDSAYYLDNVSLRTANGTTLAPEYQVALFANPSEQPLTRYLGSEVFRSIDGGTVSGSFVLEPFSSKVLIRDGSAPTDTPGSGNRLDPTPVRFELIQNYPNPFNSSTVIRYAITAYERVRLDVFDALGRLITTLVDAHQEPGRYETRFSGEELGTGVYFYRLRAGGLTATRKLLLLR
jgi:hypothetical protein